MSDMVPENVDNTQSQEPTSNVEGTQQVEETTQQPSTNQETETTSNPDYNPSWKELMDDLPDDFIRSRVKPHLEKFDKNNNSRFEKVQQQYEPYKPLIDHQIPFQDIQQAFQLRQRITENPREVFDYLAQHLGIDLSALNNQPTERQGLDNQGEEEEPLDPRIVEMQKQQQALLNFSAQQWQKEQEFQRQQQEAQWYNEVKQGLDSENITDKQERNMAVQFGLMVAQETGRPFDLKAGIQRMRDFQGQAVARSASRNSPNVSSGTGGFVAEKPDLSTMDKANEFAEQLLRARNSQK